jgi:hypothetical protein
MEICWIPPTEFLLLFLAALPSAMLLVIVVWRDSIQARKRWRHRVNH